MTPASDIFADAVRGFARAMADNFAQNVSASPEDQLKPLVGDLIKRVCAAYVNGTVDYRSEVTPEGVDGRPDLGFTLDRLLVGLVELKAPGTGARPERFRGRNREQWRRFRDLPNLIYTDGAEWSLYRFGELARRARISDDVAAGDIRADDMPRLDALLRDFINWQPIAPSTARGVAEFLAPLTRFLRDEAADELARAGGDSPLRRLGDEWGGLLFPDLDDDQFADAYAQTLAYALLIARFEGAESLKPDAAAGALQAEHALLSEALRLMEAGVVRQKLLTPIELLERAIEAVESIRAEPDEDPWLYFYEYFLAAYDSKLRKDRGVYFTPVEVARCQVRLAAALLRERFGKPLAFADDGVTVLDPAAGTGTYPLAVIDHAAQAVREHYGDGAVGGRMDGLASRLHSFEILVGPYAVAHLRISQRLRGLGVRARARVYLTDTLESPNSTPEFTASLLQESISEERKRAQEVKRDTPIVVCIGNPPYNRDLRSPDTAGARRRNGGWVRFGDEGETSAPPILEDFLAPVRESGGGVNLKALYDDYVYFWRWALWKVFDSGERPGIVTFITASSYLRGPGFAGMRRKMREVFDDLWIIDLEGDSRSARKTDNVFAIQSAVAIAIGVRGGAPNSDSPATVRKAKMTGKERDKLDALDEVRSFADLEWRECSREWDAPFSPIGAGAYYDMPSVSDVFPWQATGAALYRTWPIAAERSTLERRWRSLVSLSGDSRRAAFKESRDRKIDREYAPLPPDDEPPPAISALNADADTPDISPYAYRPFDRRWILADSRVGDFMRPVLWHTRSPNQVYLISSISSVLGEGPAALASAEIPDQHAFRGRSGDKGIIPLYKDALASKPNAAGGVLERIGEAHGTAAVSPEALFAYAYGVLSTPEYVRRFWDELEMPPPRLPITKDADLFARVSEHGAALIRLHTRGERFADGGDGRDFSLHGGARCVSAVSPDEYPEGYKYDPLAQTLTVGDGVFAPVSPEAWGYSVSGYRVVKSWLDKRKLKPSGKRSSPLDDILPERWAFTEELLELLWTLEATIALEPLGAALLAEVCASDTIAAAELPPPSAAERKPPDIARAPAQGRLG